MNVSHCEYREYQPSSALEPLMKKCTPILIVESIETCLPFWIEKLGFTKTMEVPEGETLAFVGITNGNVEVMLQSLESVINDIAALAEDEYRTVLYVEVEKLDPVEESLQGEDFVYERRKTFYGATEIGVRDPVGNVIIFAEMEEKEDNS